MKKFEKLLSDNIIRHGLMTHERPVIVAVSGGADSVALLTALDALGYECVAAHCNYHLRGEESNRDMHSVSALCDDLGVDLYMRDFNVHERCHATGESIEMACRELRYEWFASLLDKLRAQCIAVAHHREDNIETFFLNLMRGSSITGLTGMRWRNNFVVRPMLDMTREDIERYLEQMGKKFVNDSTNSENVFARNRLRNVVLPALREAFPGAEDGILKSISYLTDNRTFYDRAMGEKAEIYQKGNIIYVDDLLRDQPSARLILFEMLRPLGFNMSQVDDIMASAHKSGLTFCAGHTTLELDRGKLNIVGRTCYTPDETEATLAHDILSPVHIEVSEHPVTAFKPSRNPGMAYFDISILKGNPKFTLRRWRRGDRITPFGMKGTRLLSDIFSDAKMSAADKRNVWLLTRDGEIIWVPGIRTTDRFPVNPETRRYLQLRLVNGKDREG